MLALLVGVGRLGTSASEEVWVTWGEQAVSHTRTNACVTVPTENVASVAAGATVVEGVSRSRNALLNGNTREYDWDSGYTCHQLGCGAILVQLAQPYIVSSMR